MHERHVIFVNMMTFDKTNIAHRQAVQTIFGNLFEEGKKRGYSKYRSHINTMGRSPLLLFGERKRLYADLEQIWWLRCTISMTTRIAALWKRSRMRLIRRVS